MTTFKVYVLTLNKAVPIVGSLCPLVETINCPAFCQTLQPSAQEIGNSSKYAMLAIYMQLLHTYSDFLFKLFLFVF